jgi:hypothetical protein
MGSDDSPPLRNLIPTMTAPAEPPVLDGPCIVTPTWLIQ